VTTAVFGGAFDPPHNGHVAVLRGAELHLSFDDLLVLVVADPGHRDVHAPADVRLHLAKLAFPSYRVELDSHARTIDMLRARQLTDPVLVVGADEFEAFSAWKQPEEVLTLARLAVATRPGHSLEAARARDDRITPFEIERVPVSSSEVRRRIAAGESISELVPPAVAAEIERLGLYRD
jgi:nicotinate-nucleotide adenylyltransferase